MTTATHDLIYNIANALGMNGERCICEDRQELLSFQRENSEKFMVINDIQDVAGLLDLFTMNRSNIGKYLRTAASTKLPET